jgi:transcriptional regulator of met regulon
MGFIRRQEEKFARQLLQWQHNKTGQPLPETAILKQHAKILVDDAHRIARERGGNILTILKEAVTKGDWRA